MNATLNPPLMTNPNRPSAWYRSRDGIFLGLCKGLAEWRDVPVFWIRLGMVALTIFTFPVPVIIYLIVAMCVAKAPKPEATDTPAQNFSGVGKVLDSLERRTRRIEDAVVNRETDWDRRFHDK